MKHTETDISKGSNGTLNIAAKANCGDEQLTASRHIFNCSYSGLNQFNGDFSESRIALKHESTEMALMHAPPTLKGLGITVMDGWTVFSRMPFPARSLHTLSHVRFTPHLHLSDQKGLNPYKKLAPYEVETRVDRMIRDVARYLPAVLDATYVDSLFEVKTVLVKIEADDGRPILFEKHTGPPEFYSVLDSKIDNIYDVLEKLDVEIF
jgi:hypothetical protein